MKTTALRSQPDLGRACRVLQAPRARPCRVVVHDVVSGQRGDLESLHVAVNEQHVRLASVTLRGSVRDEPVIRVAKEDPGGLSRAGRYGNSVRLNLHAELAEGHCRGRILGSTFGLLQEGVVHAVGDPVVAVAVQSLAAGDAESSNRRALPDAGNISLRVLGDVDAQAVHEVDRRVRGRVVRVGDGEALRRQIGCARGSPVRRVRVPVVLDVHVQRHANLLEVVLANR